MRHASILSKGGFQTLNKTLGGLWIAAWIGVVWMSGCTEVSQPEPAKPTAATPRASVVPPLPSKPAVAEAAPAPAVQESAPPAGPPEQPTPPETAPTASSPPPPDPSKPRRVIGKTTRDVRDAQKEEAAGAKRVQPKVTGNDPITVTGSAYAAIIGRTEQLQIKHTIDLFYNLNGRYPKDLQEFMKEIIQANRIRLAQLPFYQEYGYDAAKHELVILEYPDRKARVPGGH